MRNTGSRICVATPAFSGVLGLVAVVIGSILSAPACAQSTLEVSIQGIRSDKGNIRIGLFTEDNFLKTPLEGKVVKASTGGVSVIFENVPDGSYAVSVVHDVNGNEVLDTNKLGIPKEGFAFSNNARGTLGPPSFDKAKIEIHEGTASQQLEMIYF